VDDTLDVHVVVKDGTGINIGLYQFVVTDEASGRRLFDGMGRTKNQCLDYVHAWARRQGYTHMEESSIRDVCLN
jgi:hypothetical protein